MTSKNSFWKLSGWNFKKRAWTLALCSVIWFFVLPVAVFVESGKLFSGMEYLEEAERLHNLAWIREMVINDVVSGHVIAVLVVTGMALLLGLQGFAWNNHQKKVDLYQSVPVKESARFWYINLNSLWIFLISLGVNMLLANAAAALKGIWNRDFAFASAMSFIMYLLLFVASYLIVLIAQYLTGNVVLGFCGASFLLAVEPAYLILCDGLRGTFYKTYIGGGMYEAVKGGVLTPLTVFVRMYKEVAEKNDGFADAGNYGGIWVYALIFLVQIAVYGAAAYLLYRKRPAQTGGKSMIFSKTKPVIKAVIMIVGSLYLAEFMASNTDQDGAVWYGLFGAVCGLLILQVVLQTIMEGNFKEAVGGKISFAAAAGVTLVVYFIYACDLTGFDTYLPDADQVESFAFVRNNDYNYTFYDQDGVFRGSEDYLLETMQITDPELKEELLSMLKQAIAEDEYYYREDNYTARVSYGQGIVVEEGVEQESLCICFRLANGKEVKRRYYLNLDDIRNYWEKLYELPEYKNSIYLMLQDQTQSWLFRQGRTPEVSYHTYNLSTSDDNSKAADLVKELFEAMKEDLANRTSDTVLTQVPVGRLDFITTWQDKTSKRRLDFDIAVYGDDSATIEILKREGWYQEAGVNKEEVAYINVYQVVDNGANQKVMRLDSNDPLFESVLESLFLTDAIQETPDPGAPQKQDYWAEIGLRGASDDSEYGSYWYTCGFYASGFPEELETAFEDIEVESDD